MSLIETIHDFTEPVKLSLDALAIGTAVAVFAKVVPVVAGVFSILWLGTQLYDRWLNPRRKDKYGDLRNDELDS